jgi:exosortase/archaeosortase family protein
MTSRAASSARLTLLAALAAAQLTLLIRGGVAGFAIMAGLSWIGGGLLLFEREEEAQPPPLEALPLRQLLPGLLSLLWALLVLSFVGRLYDPLLHLVPLAALPGLALLSGVGWRSRTLALLLCCALLLPAQVLINRFLPTEPLAVATARGVAQVLWLAGKAAVAEGDRILMPEQVLLVDASCTGVNTLSLCLATGLLLALLIPHPLLRRHPGPGALLLALPTAGLAFSVNLVRIVLLALTEQERNPAWWGALTHFDFWHDGAGSISSRCWPWPW